MDRTVWMFFGTNSLFASDLIFSNQTIDERNFSIIVKYCSNNFKVIKNRVKHICSSKPHTEKNTFGNSWCVYSTHIENVEDWNFQKVDCTYVGSILNKMLILVRLNSWHFLRQLIFIRLRPKIRLSDSILCFYFPNLKWTKFLKCPVSHQTHWIKCR